MSYEPIPARGPGAEKFDAPALFYLSNQAQIDEWYGLRATVSDALGDWFRTTVREALAQLGTTRGMQVSDARGPGGHYSLVLHLPETPIQNGKPVVGVGLAWQTKSVNPVSTPPFVTIRCSRNDTGKDAARIFLDAGGREYRKTTDGVSGSESDAWPAWSWVRAEDKWWTDLEGYRDVILGKVRRFLDDLGVPIEAALRVQPVGTPDEVE